MIRRAEAAVAIVAALLLATTASAQRRDGSRAAPAVLEVKFPTAVSFAGKVVKARKYRVNVTGKDLVFVHPSTMVTAARAPFVESQNSDTVTPATVQVVEKSTTVQVIVRTLDRIYTATGEKADGSATRSTNVTLAGKTETTIAGGEVVEKTEKQNVERALKRYVTSVKHCADKAQKSRWKTDDKRFVRCVCPQAERWRLPKTSGDVRVHFHLAHMRSGFSITATAKGRGKNCKVWVGRGPPPDPKPPVVAETAPVEAPPAPVAESKPAEPDPPPEAAQ